MRNKGQINLEFLASALLFLLVIGSMLTIASDSLPSFSESLTVTANRMEAYAISSKMISQPGMTSSGETDWAASESKIADVKTFGLAKNENKTHILSRDKINSLRSIDIGLSTEYVNYSEFKSITGAENNYRFNFTWKPVFYSSKSFQKRPFFDREDSLQAYYEFENESGNVLDSSDNGRIGTNNGAERGVKGAYESKGFEFENGEWIKLEQNFSVDSNISISLWYKNDIAWDPSGDYFIMMGDDEGANKELSFGVENNNLKFKFFNGTDDYGILAGEKPPLNEWVHLVGTYNDSSGRWRIYQNGEKVEEKNDPVNISLDTQDDNYINRGEGETEPQRGMEGKIDEIRIYNSTVDINKVNQLYSPRSKIRRPETSQYLLDSPKTYYGTKKLENTTQYYLISSLGSQSSVYISDNWNMTDKKPKILGDSYSIDGERYLLEGITAGEGGATMVVSKNINTFGSNVDSDSSVIRLSRYAVMDDEPLEMEVLAW